jgi:hypothetical protein
MAYQQIKKFGKVAKKGGVPQLSRAVENEILDWLHTTTKLNLFGDGSWPADAETRRTYWLIFKRYVSISLSGDGWYLTPFGQEIDISSFGAFIGVNPDACLAAFDWDQAGEAELEELIDDLAEDADEHRGNELTKRFLRGVYIRYCAKRGIDPFSPTSPSVDGQERKSHREAPDWIDPAERPPRLN